MIKKLLFFGLFLCANGLQAVVATGDPDAAEGTTFSFSVGSALYEPANQRLWTLSGQDTSSFSTNVQSYGISYIPAIKVDSYLGESLVAYPFLSTQAYLTSVEDNTLIVSADPVTNPLLGKQFSAVSLVGNSLTVVDSATPRFIYLIQRVIFNDGTAYGKSSPEGISIINMLDLGLTYQAVGLGTSLVGSLFIANSQGTFGTDNSYISFATTSLNTGTIDGVETRCTTLTKQADEQISVATPVLTAGGGDLSALNSQVVMCQAPMRDTQMYIGVDVTAGSGLSDQAVAVFAATAQAATTDDPAAMVFSSIIPDAVAGQNIQTPVSTTRTLRVAVPNVTTTTTSTGLSYFITSRFSNLGNQFVYAMPMVTMSSDSSHNGKIANVDSIAQTFQIIGITYRVQGFDTVIDDAEQINIASSSQAVLDRLQVGAGPVPLATDQFIEQLLAQGDSVYITIQEPFSAGSTPGMFKSQAIFDAQGRIQAWTPWQRVAGTDDQMLFAMKDKFTDATMFVSGSTSNTVQQTTWNNSTDLTSCIAAINASLPFSQGGVQAIIPVSNQTPDLSALPLVIAAGNQAVVVTQTGSVNGDGQVVIDNPQNSITITSDLGLDIGSVVTATFAHHAGEDNNWLFMGGDNGLAVISNDTTGIGFHGELTDLQDLVAAGQSCKTIGNFKFVKKLVSSDDNLYVLTTSGVYQIALNANKFKETPTTDLDPQLVVQGSSGAQFSYCLDMLVDNGLMLLGTTAGLYSLDLSGTLPATPVAIQIPGGLPAVSRLTTVSTSGIMDVDFYAQSNLYVLTIDFALQQACLNRFTITNGVITPIQDQLLQGQNGPLLEFDYMNNNIFIDGSFGFATAYKIGELPATVRYLQYTLQAGRSSAQSLMKAHTSDISIRAVLNTLGLAGIARDYASGCLMLAGTFGLLTDS